MNQHYLVAFAHFLSSTLLTAWFVWTSPVYISDYQMLLSTGIAGGKWALQILFAFFLLSDKAAVFIREIGFVCHVGSLILLPYCLFSFFNLADGPGFFLGSLLASVAVMIPVYALAVRKSGVSSFWWYGWLCCLATAITLQLTVVFKIV